MSRTAQNILADQIKGIVAGVKRFESTETLHELHPVFSGIRILMKERGDGSIYKDLNLGKINILSTLFKPSDLPQSDAIVSTFTGMTQSHTGMRASTLMSAFRELIPINEWWENVSQVIEGTRLSRKDVVLDSQTDGILHRYPLKKKGVKELALRDALHFQYVKQYGYELGNSPQLLGLANLDAKQLWQVENLQ